MAQELDWTSLLPATMSLFSSKSCNWWRKYPLCKITVGLLSSILHFGSQSPQQDRRPALAAFLHPEIRSPVASHVARVANSNWRGAEGSHQFLAVANAEALFNSHHGFGNRNVKYFGGLIITILRAGELKWRASFSPKSVFGMHLLICQTITVGISGWNLLKIFTSNVWDNHDTQVPSMRWSETRNWF
jgi:hypothetical protein